MFDLNSQIFTFLVGTNVNILGGFKVEHECSTTPLPYN